MTPVCRIAIIAAAGRGTRFRHTTPKVLAELHGQPCLRHVLDTVEAALGEHLQLVLVGDNGDRVIAALGEAAHRRYVRQPAPRGTGDALATALAALPAELDADVYFLCGDKPLLRAATLAALREEFEGSPAGMAFLVGQLVGDPADSRQGRVVSRDGQALAIVERKAIDALAAPLVLRDADGHHHTFGRDALLAATTVNVSTYVWRLSELRRLVPALQEHATVREVLITDLVQTFNDAGLPVRTLPLTDPREGLGIDTVEDWQALAAGAR